MRKTQKVLIILFAVVALLVTAQAALGDVVINEVMPNPAAVDDAVGEYIELFNTGDVAVNIDGYTLEDFGGNPHTIDNGGVLNVPAKGYLLLCRDADVAVNGVLGCDYEYGSFDLVNTGDVIFLHESAGGAIVDFVDYDETFPFSAGVAMELIDPSLDGELVENWRAATVAYGSGDLGTPGQENNVAPNLNVEDRVVEEDSGFAYFNLQEAASDEETNDEELLFFLESQTGSEVITCGLDDGSHIVNCKTQENQFGENVVTVSVVDENGAEAVDTFTITVNAVNDAPEVGEDVLTVDEDSEVNFVDVLDNDNDVEDGKPTVVSVTEATNGVVGLNNGLVTYTPNENFFGSDLFAYTVQDTESEEATAFVEVTVISVNDVPVVDVIDDVEVVESTTETITVTATDVEGSDLEIDTALSTIDGEAFEDLSWVTVDGLGFKVTPDTAGSFDVSVVVTDVIDSSEPVNFDLEVVPALQIVEVTIDGEVINTASSAKIDVTAGDEVTVAFTYTNNLDESLFGDLINSWFGDIETLVVSNPGVLVENANGENELLTTPHHEPKNPTLKSGETGEVELTFTVPKDIGQDSLNMAVSVKGKILGIETYQDAASFAFNVGFNVVDVYVDPEMTIEEDLLICDRTATVHTTMTNIGATPVLPTIMVFDEPAEIDADSGIVTSTGNLLAEKLVQPGLAPGETLEAQVNVDGGSLAVGEHTLYVYVESNYFWSEEAGHYFGGEGSVVVNVEDCLNTEAIEADLIVDKNEENALSLNLLEVDVSNEYEYVNEEIAGAAAVEFSIVEDGQSNEELISCSIEDEQTLVCEAPKEDSVGTSEITLGISASGSKETFEESVTVTVATSLGLTDVTVNGVSGDTLQEDGVVVKPLGTVELSFMLENSLEETLIQIEAIAVDTNALGDGYEFEFDEEDTVTTTALAAGESTSTQTISFVVPGNVPEGEYEVGLMTTGVTLDDELFGDLVEFPLHVVPELSEIILTAEFDDADNTVSCDATGNLKFTITNTGSVEEDDVVLTFYDNGEQIDKLEEMTVAVGQTWQGEHEVTLEEDGEHTLTVTLEYNFAGDEAASSATPATAVVTKEACLGDTFSPKETEVSLQDGVTQEFSIETNSAISPTLIAWTVTDETGAVTGESGAVIEEGSGTKFSFSSLHAGEFTVKVVVNGNEAESREWTVTVVTVPVDAADFGFTGEVADPATVSGLELSQNDATIVFTESVDISDVDSFADVVTLSKVSADKRVVAVDSTTAPGLDSPATVTLENFPDGDTSITRYPGFGDVDTLTGGVDCIASGACVITSQADSTLTFTVDGFSTYVVQNEQAADIELSVSEVAFSDVHFSETTTSAFTVTNVGTSDTITGLTFDTSSIGSEYAVVITDAPVSLDSQESQTVTVQITVPEDGASGKHTIGNVVVSWDGAAESVTLPVTISPESFLSISKVEINGKTSGDLKIDEDTEIEVEITNDYSEDMEDVEVTVTILDVDGDDLDEDDEIGDLDEGDDDTVTLKFDLQNEDIDEEKYTIEIKVEGTADDDTEHETIITKEVDVDIESHALTLKHAGLSVGTVQCSALTTVQVTALNIGSKDENDVAIRVRNSALGLDSQKTGIDIDKFFDNDNDYKTSFTVAVDKDVAPGTYPITVELFRDDDKLEDSEVVNLVVQDCFTSQSSEQAQSQLGSGSELAAQLQAQLNAQLQGTVQQGAVPVGNSAASVTSSFRQSNTYLLLLGSLALLVFIALILAIAVAAKRKRR